MAALDGARSAHIAAHGALRADSPSFSAPQLADGPLTVPGLSGADELISPVSTPISLGSVGVAAIVVPIDDRRTIPLMLALHARLRGGAALGKLIHGARQTISEEPRAQAATDSFIAWGV